MENPAGPPVNQENVPQPPIYPNPEIIQHVNTIPPSYPPKKRILNRRILIIFIPVLAIILGLVIFFITKYQKSKSGFNQKELSTGVISINCELSGQTPDSNFVSGENTFSGISQGEEGGSKVIARILHKDPAVVEILDYEQWPDYSTSETIIRQSISNGEREIFEALNYGDIFEADEYSYYTAGIELGIGTDFYKIEKLSDSPTYFHQDVSSFPLLNRSGRLISYTNINDDKELVIFKDGKVYYKSSTGTLIIDKQLTQTEIDELLKLFANSNYNTLENSYNFYDASLMLVCNRFQNIPLESNEAVLKPIIDYLDNFINSFESNLKVTISYRNKDAIDMREWPFAGVPIDQIKLLHEDALDYNRKYGSVQADNLIYTSIPDDIWNEIPLNQSYTNQTIPKVYYKDKGGVYYVSKGAGKCLADRYGNYSSACLEKTLYILTAKEIKSTDNENDAVKLWPENLGVDLSAIQDQELASNIYINNKEFFDSIGNFGVNNNFIDDNYLYRNVGILKTESGLTKKEVGTDSYLLKVYEKSKVHDWIGPGQISTYAKGFMREDDEDTRLEELSYVYPDLISELKSEGMSNLFFKDGDNYYYFLNLRSGPDYSISLLEISKTTDGFTGFSFWEDKEVVLADIPVEGLRISPESVQNNQIMLQFRTDRYFFEDGYVYVLDLSNEPED